MAEFLTTHGTAFQIENVIAGAKERLTLVSPFLKLSKTLAERLQDAARRGVSITIVFGKKELDHEQEAVLAGLSGVRLYFLPNLHAKCYYNEERMVITSMNMYEYSEKTNREMGVLLNAGDPAYASAVQEVGSIIAASELRSEGTPARSHHQQPQHEQQGSSGGGAAVCIRCKTGVPRNPYRPLCNTCYGVWASYQGDADYQEQWCHLCGRQDATSVNRPLCWRCYRRAARTGEFR